MTVETFTNALSANIDFQLDNFLPQLSTIDDGKLYLGGSSAGYPALAQVSITDGNVEFAKTYLAEGSIVAIARAPQSSATHLVALSAFITNKISTALLLEIGSDGTLL